MTPEDNIAFSSAKECYICKKGFNRNDVKVRDHCHLTGTYRGAAHKSCNLELRVDSEYPERNNIPVFFHNLRGFDGHLIMQALGHVKSGRLNCIPNNMEKYMAFNLGQLHFRDSFQHLNTSLGKLVEGLSKDKFIITPRHITEHADLVARKGVYPYDYMNSFNKFDETELPSKEAFYNNLTTSGITDAEYDHAKLVWSTFGVRNMGEYHDLYLQSDVLLLADVFEAYRDTSIKDYGLDPANYITLPGMSWDGVMRMTKATPERLLDIDMYHFCEQGIRGGVCTTGSKRYAKANNPLCPDYNPNNPTTWIIDLDANNLYAQSLSQTLPYSGFEWVLPSEINIDQILATPDRANIGYFTEVDLHVP
mgnify:FL=1